MGDPYKPRKRYCRPLSLFSSACHPSIAPPPRWSTPLEGLRLPQLSRVRAPFVVPLWRVCVAQLPLYSARGPCGGEGHAPRATPARLKRPCNLRVPLSRLPPPPPRPTTRGALQRKGRRTGPSQLPRARARGSFNPWPSAAPVAAGGPGRGRRALGARGGRAPSRVDLPWTNQLSTTDPPHCQCSPGATMYLLSSQEPVKIVSITRFPYFTFLYKLWYFHS